MTQELIDKLRNTPETGADPDIIFEAADLLESQADEIEHYKSGLDSAVQDIAKLKALCDQMGDALLISNSDFSHHIRQVNAALEAWRG